KQMSVAEAVRRLHEVADGLGTGALRLGRHAVNPVSTVKYEEECSAETTDEGTTFELELEMKWNAAAADGRASPAPESATGAKGRFELFKDVGGKFRFRLRAANGQIIASSEAYESKAAAQKGITSVRTNAPTGRIDDRT
ncbi:MAG TPA: DUF1508 domain-containing protein, partial [Acidimicrobiales bacterium]